MLTGAVPLTTILAQNGIMELQCRATYGPVVRTPEWQISNGMVQGVYPGPDADLKDVFIEIKEPDVIYTDDNGRVIKLTLCMNGSVANNGTTLQCTTDLDEIDVTVMVQGNEVCNLISL